MLSLLEKITVSGDELCNKAFLEAEKKRSILVLYQTMKIQIGTQLQTFISKNILNSWITNLFWPRNVKGGWNSIYTILHVSQQNYLLNFLIQLLDFGFDTANLENQASETN